ncbi:CinA family protein [Eubacterium xylanophilum]|uniref:CinA family protein n=1 Tax=Eubacterium xylanophilum TaxID=39497 RepID=UPI00047E6BA3|nr:nicotinamide-nucleotide amidohydrolase family protein [Eubacterium xylanophilum]
MSRELTKECLQDWIVKELTKQHATITCAESCTGGLIAGAIIDSPGASAVFNESYVTYANESKMGLLGVREETLERFGAVSEECAREMAYGAAKRAGADVAICSTGIAGPDGGTPEKPVGLVYISCFYRDKVVVEKLNLSGSRSEIRRGAVDLALELVKKCITSI